MAQSKDRQTVRGVIAAVSVKEFGDSTNYSFRIGENWYRSYDEPFEGILDKGASVEVQYEVTTSKNGNTNNVVKSMKRVQGEKAASRPSARGNASSPDVGLQIQYQHSQEMALRFVDILLRTEAVSPGKTPSKRVAVLESLFDRYTAAIHNDVQNLGALTRVTSEDNPTPKSADGDDVEAGDTDD